MRRYRGKGPYKDYGVVEAVRWWKHGNLPDLVDRRGYGNGNRCADCGRTWEWHGALRGHEGKGPICPGNWVVASPDPSDWMTVGPDIVGPYAFALYFEEVTG